MFEVSRHAECVCVCVRMCAKDKHVVITAAPSAVWSCCARSRPESVFSIFICEPASIEAGQEEAAAPQEGTAQRSRLVLRPKRKMLLALNGVSLSYLYRT